MNPETNRPIRETRRRRVALWTLLATMVAGCLKAGERDAPPPAQSARTLAASIDPVAVQPMQVLEAAPATALWIRSEADLRAAAWASRERDVNLIFDRMVEVRRGIVFPASDSIVRLIGLHDKAGIHFAMRFDGDWTNPDFRGENGLEFRSRQAILRGLLLTGYEYLGSVVKFHGTELLDVSGCTFDRIGTVQFAHKVAPPRSASDTLYNHCINAQSVAGGHISIVNCRFRRSIHNNHRWSHCVYVSARSVLVTGCWFDDCGNAIGVGGKVAGASNQIFGNTITNPHAQLHPTAGRALQPYLAGLGTDSVAFCFNVVAGEHYRPWTGQPDPDRHLIDFNSYGAMSYRGQWAANTAQGVYILWPAWLAMGFDRHSTPPMDLGVRMPE